MSAVAPTLPAFAVGLGGGGSGAVNYTLPPGVVWRLQALAFTVDLSGSAHADDVFLRVLSQDGTLVCGQCPGSGQAAGSVIAYTLAQDLNPCDGITSSFLNLTPDTFAPLTLTGGCQIVIEARVQTTGTLDTTAAITKGVAWVETGGGTPLPELAPLLVPLPLVDQGFSGGGGG